MSVRIARADCSLDNLQYRYMVPNNATVPTTSANTADPFIMLLVKSVNVSSEKSNLSRACLASFVSLSIIARSDLIMEFPSPNSKGGILLSG